MIARSRMRYLTATSVAMLCAAAAQAQDTSSSTAVIPAADAGQRNGLEEILVTARRSEERLQTVPISVSAFTSAALDKQAASNIRDLQGLVPNLTMDQNPVGLNQASFFIRGIGLTEYERSSDPAVAIYVNDVYKPATVGTALDTFDIGSIQVLRGPQGTLFGKNTIGGAVLVQTSRPTGAFGGKVSATLGSFHRRDFKALFNMPIIDGVLALKLAGATFNDDGEDYNLATKSRVGGRSDYIIRPALLFTPASNVEFLLEGEYYHNNGQQQPLQSMANVKFNPILCSLGYCGPAGRHVVNVDDISPVRATYKTASLRGKIDLGTVTLNVVTAYQDDKDSLYNDFDATPVPIVSAARIGTQKTFTQEIRLSTNPSFSDRLKLVSGLYYFNSKYTAITRVDHILQFSAKAPLGAQSLQDAKQKTVDYAAFAQGSYQLTDELTATVGGRYTYEKKNFQGQGGSTLAPRPAIVFGNITQRKFTPHVDLAYQMTRDSLLYASWSRGFRAGGFAGRSTTKQTIGPYKPENVDAYEIGSKNELFDRHVRLNLSAFYTKYKDKQETITTFDPSFGSIQQISNAGAVTLWGLEAEATVVASDRFTVSGSAGYLNAKYNKFFADLLGNGIVTDNSDLKPQDSPKFSASIQPSYHVSAGSGELSFTPTYRWTDKFWIRADAERNGDTRALYPAIGMLDLVVAYELPVNDTEWRISAFVRNATDEYAIRYQVSTALSALAGELQGRTWGVSVEAKF